MLATVNGVTLGYDDSGVGTPIVFIHGFPLNRKTWEPQQRALQARYRTISVDLPGHGESALAPGTASMSSYAQAVIDLLDHLKISQAVFCGLSMGGYVAFALAREHADRALGFVFASTRAVGDTPEAAQGRRNLAATVRSGNSVEPVVSGMFPRMFKDGAPSEEHGASIKEIMSGSGVETVAKDLEALADRPDSTPVLRSIRKPALVIHGDKDVLIPFADAEYQATRIPGSVLVALHGVGHLSNIEAPEAFNEALGNFLTGLK